MAEYSTKCYNTIKQNHDDIMHDDKQLIKDLNKEQQEAVSAPPSHQRIIAGAGSGKTRVLVHRIAWLIDYYNIPPQAILAVTFTNKAANAIRARIQNLLPSQPQGMWLGTFHSICHRILRQHYHSCGLEQSFQVIDQDDQLRLIKKIQQMNDIDEKIMPARKTQYFINQQKDRGIRANQVDDNHTEQTALMQKIYRIYEQTCVTSHLVDFNELILKVVESLNTNTLLKKHLQSIFRFILVDEFQDTNFLQFQLIKIIAGEHNYVSIVGDDDQSIYSWRGALIENIHDFELSFPDSTTTRLEQNYRSTGHILQAANALIAHNEKRLGKNLWTDQPDGNKIQLLCAYNEHEEARYITENIAANRQLGKSYNDQAILYRSNAQSRVIEEQLTRAGIPYIIYGGLRFFERAEIKDALGYLRLLINPNDDSAFERIINTPSRGIGQASLDKIRQYAQANMISMWQSSLQHIESKDTSKRLKEALQSFKILFEHITPKLQSITLAELLETLLQTTGLIPYLQKQHPETAKNKLENLQELIHALAQYQAQNTSSSTLLLASNFIAEISLDNRNPNEKKAEQDNQSQVQLMTLHAAKGLEFKEVYLTGMEEGLFPHKMAIQDGRELEEERRLCYVGMTRAMETLHVSYAENRRVFNQDNYQIPSRFIQEIPSKHINYVSSNMQQPSHHQFQAHSNQAWQLGTNVKHPTFGEGTILNTEGSGPQCRIQVRFRQHGVKWLIAEYAKLEPCH